ncbi:hypothetical protein PVAND_008551 [Polypedilum vanderplanki]|uniref:Lipase domain-containing protein n=1 Tax=Polypedilum vanderplanki TaxID=319348 RepID=A0A9J6CA46_POLVA|nr:hypothetical protein PVAND_008551 [Polypedilum vanderplanki]
MKFLFFIICLIFYEINALTVDGGINLIFFGKSFTDITTTTLDFNFASLKGTTYFDIKKPTAVFAHGYLTDYKTPMNKDLIKAYIYRGDYNVISIDWSKYSWDWNIFAVANSTNDQADYIRQILLQMKSAGFDLSTFHFIGHCVGANILGRVGYQFIKNNTFTLTRITGLDPSSAFFGTSNEWPDSWSELFPSLNKKNAKFVDIIHTDAGFQGLNYVGGHADFWVNGGNNQPKCSFFDIFTYQADDMIRCSHNRAVKYYTESVESTTKLLFISTKCVNNTYTAEACTGSISSMGIYANKYAANEGNFFVSTNGTSPYSTSSLLLIDGGINLVFFGKGANDYKSTTLDYNYASLKGTRYFDISKPTAVYAHGFNSKFLDPDIMGIGEAFISREDHNVIAVDWQKYTSNFFYPEVAGAVDDVASFIVKMLIQMQTARYNLTTFYFIGHSLGAQLMGRIGYQLKSNYNFTISRITALDPAGPQFGSFNDWPTSIAFIFPAVNKLNAKFVDVIHTDAGSLGDSYSVAHVDFWPNGGFDQPLCSISPTNYNCNATFDVCIGCDHGRSIRYFSESVRSLTKHKFKSFLCSTSIIAPAACTGSISSMGFYANLYAANEGNYYCQILQI